MSLTPSIYVSQFQSSFRYKKGSRVPLTFVEQELYLDKMHSSLSELERYLRHHNIIHNPSFEEDSKGVRYLKDYEYIGTKKFPSIQIKEPIPTIYERVEPKQQKQEVIQEKQREKTSSKKKTTKLYDEDDYKSQRSSQFSFVTQSDIETIRRDINGLQSEFQTHGDKLYSAVKKQEDYIKRMENVCNAQDHLEWLQDLDFDSLPANTRKLLIKRLLHSNINNLLNDVTEVLTEEDGRKHNVLLVIDGVDSSHSLENRSLWSNSNRGNYTFKMHDDVSFFSSLFGSDERVIESKTKSDLHIREHLKK